MHRGTRLLLIVGLLCTTAESLAAQRPKTAEQALARFAKVRDQSESERQRSAGDLGPFAEAEVTELLLEELEGAQDLGYQQTLVRALGQSQRGETAAVVAALLAVLDAAKNPRLADSAAEGLARQGDTGVEVLGRILERDANGMHRNAACSGLAIATGERARDLLVEDVRRTGGRARLAPFGALSRRVDEPVVDELRLLLARDKDHVVAAEALEQLANHGHAEAPALALELSRRLPAGATAEHHAAVLHGLLLRIDRTHDEPILTAAAASRDPFADNLRAPWQRALADAEFLRFLTSQGPARKQPGERRLAAMALALTPLPQAATAQKALVRMLADKDLAVVRAAAAVLPTCGRDLAIAPLEKLLTNGPDASKPAAAAALHEMRRAEPAWHEQLRKFAQDRNPTLQATALHLLARSDDLDTKMTLQSAGDNLANKSWQVRAAAVDLILALRLEPGIPWLIERVDEEQARLREDVLRALEQLTKVRLADTAAWRIWWQKEGPGFRIAPLDEKQKKPGRDQGGTAASYWNIPVRSDRIAFVVDISGSMNQPFGTGGGTRLDEAKRQLVRVLGMLPPKAKANIVVFGTEASVWQESLQTIDDKRRKSGEEFTKGLAARTATNVHAGLQRAFADADVDTIFLLTDGQPSTGEIVAPDELAKAVAFWNLGRGLRIHTVAIGGPSPFLERLARDSGGEHAVAR